MTNPEILQARPEPTESTPSRPCCRAVVAIIALLAVWTARNRAAADAVPVPDAVGIPHPKARPVGSRTDLDRNSGPRIALFGNGF
jgi:hypothetical protein